MTIFEVLFNFLVGILGGIISSVIVSRVFFIQGMLNAMPNPNLYQFVINGINRNKNFEYKPRNEMNSNAIKGDM